MLNPDDNYVVLINTYTVDPSRAEDLLEAMADVNERGMSRKPGFVSSNLHISADRRHVANYAQWATQADVDAMLADEEAQQYAQSVAELAISSEPIFYKLRNTISRM